jgi:two-component system cell cycle response regulator DivK
MSKCILVVEDQEDNRQILRDLLGSAGYELTEAENGEEAVAAVAKRRPDLILMDIHSRSWTATRLLDGLGLIRI